VYTLLQTQKLDNKIHFITTKQSLRTMMVTHAVQFPQRTNSIKYISVSNISIAVYVWESVVLLYFSTELGQHCQRTTGSQSKLWNTLSAETQPPLDIINWLMYGLPYWH